MLLIQLTGLSGAGKSTLAWMVKEKMLKEQLPVVVIDGDEYRKTLCADLGFSREDRCENVRRLGGVAHEYGKKGFVSIIAAINPYESARAELTDLYAAKTVHIYCPLPVLIDRDTKGLYKKALLTNDHPDKINNLTGVNDPYEAPLHPDLFIDTSILSADEAVTMLADFIRQQLHTR